MVAGKWNIVISSQLGDNPAVLDLRQDGEKLEGAIARNNGEAVSITDGKADASGFSFKFPLKIQYGDFIADVKGTVDGDNISGSLSISIGSASFKGSRA